MGVCAAGAAAAVGLGGDLDGMPARTPIRRSRADVEVGVVDIPLDETGAVAAFVGFAAAIGMDREVEEAEEADVVLVEEEEEDPEALECEDELDDEGVMMAEGWW